MRPNTSLIFALIVMAACMFSSPVSATMGGIANIGPVLASGDSSTAIREYVELKQSGRLWVGRPNHELVSMLTLYAPGLTKGHLILRELTTSEGKQTLLLTAPEAVTAHVQRVTLYFQGLPETMVLFEEVDGEWKKRFPQAMTIDSRIDGTISTQAIRAFSVKNLGFYWLLEPATAMPAVFYTPLATSAMTLMGGELTRGLMPSILAIMLLLVFGAVSRYIHKTSKLREL